MKANGNEVINIKKEKLNVVIVRSRANWSEKNEKSNKYINGLLKTRKKRKELCEISNEKGELITEKKDIEKEVHSFYRTLFQKNPVLPSSQSTLFSNVESKLNEAEIYSLDKKIDKTEIMNVIEESPNNKSPGPDGLCFEFYKKIKEKISNNLVKIFNNFEEMKKWI
ncbi:LINE-1 retrotransposable element ORF2 protein [Smittium culicis]|uniref:LINE-1 retrotransposable element ORF2 protein n=1 Tax=Smittium culicis TaxID=133412 RepID=A0A1R1XYW3_9FUNG|nr:LINE-1 retrotransposable element ORF2 protein [Smittium culicis]